MTGFVYFIKPVSLPGPIKIGYSNNIKNRLKALMQWSPLPLEVLAFVPGDRKLEYFLHQFFASTNSHQEWFHPSEFLLDVIRRVSAGEPLKSVIAGLPNQEARETQMTPLHQAILKYGSQQRLAYAIGLSQVAITKAKKRVEEGKQLSPRLSILISRDLGIPLSETWPTRTVRV